MSRLFCICFFGTKIYPIFARMSKNENIINKVLIIDDEPQIRQLLARILGLEGYEVLQAGDCKAAVKQFSQCCLMRCFSPRREWCRFHKNN